jgi:hypothetical protein
MTTKERIEKEASNYVGPGFRHDREIIKIHFTSGYEKGWNEALDRAMFSASYYIDPKVWEKFKSEIESLKIK